MQIQRSFLQALLLCAFSATPASAAFVEVWGGPTYDPMTQTGYRNPVFQPAFGSTAGGVAAGNGSASVSVEKYGGGTYLGYRAVRWDASGAAATELGNLGTDSSGATTTYAMAINTTGAAIGLAQKYNGGTYLGYRAVRWDASGTAGTELDNLGTSSIGFTLSYGYAINAAGTAVGSAQRYNSGADRGARAVRWNAAGTAATELDNLGTGNGGVTISVAHAINAAGAAVGFAQKYAGNELLGTVAVRWNASGTAATELGNLGTDSSGHTLSDANAINAAGTAVGAAYKHSGGKSLGYRAVRWDASGTGATELGNLATDSSGITTSVAYDINAAGTAVGTAGKFSGSANLGPRAVRWDASGTAATQLGDLGTDSTGVTGSYAYAINTAGAAVGYAEKYTGGTDLGSRAVLWNADAVAIDLNTLIDPDRGWTLTTAAGINDTNWVTGIGRFDPDGPGPLPAYDRAFLLNVATAVPEPASLGLWACASTLLILRHRRHRITNPLQYL